MKKLPRVEASATLIGTIIGAGILGIPYAVARSGFVPGVFIMMGVFMITVLLQLMYAEVTLRTPHDHQIPGYGGIYLGNVAKQTAAVVGLLSWYGILLAYMIGGGEVLQALFGGSEVIWSLVFWTFGSFVVWRGIFAVAKSEVVMIGFVLLIVALIGMFSYRNIDIMNLLYRDVHNIFFPYGVLLFAFAGTSTIPQMRKILRNNEKDFAASIIVANIVVLVVYLIFTLVTVGISGWKTTQIASIGLGEQLGTHMVLLGNILAAFTMGTSFLTIGLAVRRTLEFDYLIKREKALVYTLVAPLILFAIGIREFIIVLSVVGGVLIGIQNIIIILSFWEAKREGKRKPEFSLGRMRIVGVVFMTIFALGALFTLLKL